MTFCSSSFSGLSRSASRQTCTCECDRCAPRKTSGRLRRKCSRDIAWTKTYGKSRVCYLMFGHDDDAWNNPNYRMLLLNAIHWASEGITK